MPPPKKATAKSAGAPTWMVTFGDLMALLLTLFVLLFTYSTLDVVKYKALAGALNEAFGSTFIDSFTGDEGVPTATVDLSLKPSEDLQEESVETVVIESEPEEPVLDDVDESDILKAAQEAMKFRSEQLESKLIDAISAGSLEGLVDIERKDDRVLIRFPNKVAFPAGSAETTGKFEAAMKNLTNILSTTAGEIIIGGHTDNVPIMPGGRYRSNWELSAARAAAVVHILLKDDVVSPERLTIQGFADSRPRVNNDTEDNRAMNRRVEITILTDTTPTVHE